ncbi:MAG: helix-turn-helix domain-containing protein [Noviherbaspirillum sp.]
MTKSFTPEELELMLGDNVKALRLQRNIDQASLAERAGISVTALKNLESGKGATIKTLVRTLRSLGKETWIESLAPVVSINPLHMVKDRPVRMRARRRKDSRGNDES